MQNLISVFLVLYGTMLSYAQNVTSLDYFNSVKVSGNINVELVPSSDTKIEYKVVKGNESDFIIEVDGNTLKLKIKSKVWKMGGNNTRVEAKVYYKDLYSIDASAGSYVMTQSIIKANDFNIDVSSGASSTVKLDVTSLVADASSGASIQLEGTAKNVNYDGSSGASIKGERLHALNVNADVSSGASIKLFVAETLVGDASSGGSILYKGNPKSKNLDSGKMSGGSIRPF